MSSNSSAGISKSLLEGKISTQLLRFFTPIFLGTLLQQLYNTVDSVVVSNYVGEIALGAVGGTTSTIINVLIGFFVGVSSGAGVVLSQAYGKNDLPRVKKIIHCAISFSLLGGIFLTVFGVIFAESILTAMNTPPEILPMAVTYLTIYFFGITINLVYNISSGILRAMGDSKRPLFFLMVGTITNIILDLIFVVGLKLGVGGVAYATIISQLVSTVLSMTSLRLLPSEIRFSVKELSIQKNIMLSIFRIGIPAGLQSILYSLSNLLIQRAVNGFGTDTVAAWTAYGKIDVIYWSALSSFGIAISTFTGQCFGAGNIDRLKEGVKTCTKIVIIMAIFISSFLLIFGRTLLRLFLSTELVLDIGIQIIYTLVPFYLLYVAVEVFSGVMRAVGDTLIPTLIATFGICGLRIIWIYGYAEKTGNFIYVCLTYPITWFITATLFILYYKFGGWLQRAQKRALLQQEIAPTEQTG